jgi:ubiquinone/menaquinone biosynthesis C-methylase UbiE
MTQKQVRTQVVDEQVRIRAENRRRQSQISPDLYAPWRHAAAFMSSERKRKAAIMLHDAGVFPGGSSRCLEIGFGWQGWLGDLVTWSVQEANIHGIELDSVRVAHAQKILPAADLRTGDATNLPWSSESFDLVIASTVFTSILDRDVRRLAASEIVRVLAPGGALLWYDFRVNNPQNRNVRKVSGGELASLFKQLHGKSKSVTLAPPICRIAAPVSWTMATALSSIPFLRTHLLAVLLKS